jgi:hypothetical protein
MLLSCSLIATEDAMKAALMERMRKVDAKRLIAMGVAPGVLALGLDAAISHFAGREMAHPAQLTPVTFAPAAAAALLFLAAPHRTAELFRRGIRVVGVLATLVGLIGTGFHARALMRLLEGAPITFAALKAALAVAPPLFAPGAFAAVGVVLYLVGNPRLTIAVRDVAPAAGLARLEPRTA